jgi:hypothetical protein
MTVGAVRYQWDRADETANPILVAVGIDDREAGHRRIDLNVPDSIQWTSSSCFCDSLVKSLTFSLTSSLKRLAGFARFSVERISVPQRLETIEDGAFEDCRFLAVVDFSSCTNLRVVNGFSGCTAILQITMPICVEMIGRRAFNNCVSLRHLAFEEG